MFVGERTAGDGLLAITTARVIFLMYKPDHLASLLTILQWLTCLNKLQPPPCSLRTSLNISPPFRPAHVSSATLGFSLFLKEAESVLGFWHMLFLVPGTLFPHLFHGQISFILQGTEVRPYFLHEVHQVDLLSARSGATSGLPGSRGLPPSLQR